MSQLTRLKSATSLRDVADLLGFKASALSYILYKKNSASKYRTFEIPKRHGGTRKISAPSAELKFAQQRLSDLLQNCVDELNQANGRADGIAHGFKRGRSIITNAKEHRNRKHVFNVDLADFFGSINFGRVRGFLIKDKGFSLHPDVATVLAQIACHDGGLPQGSPCSPVISNLVGHILDIHLVRLASKYGCRYSRYADDLTFSTNKSEFPPLVARRMEGEDHEWCVGEELDALIKKSGFSVNRSKTRMQYQDSRQEVTGLIVNRKVNIRSEYRKTVRAMVHRLFTKGSFEFVYRVTDATGKVSVSKAEGASDQLHGMLGFIDSVDLYNKGLINGQGRTGKKQKDQSALTTKETMYRRFLLFKLFYAAPAPVILTEGKTDNVYIAHAIRSLAPHYPALAEKSPDGKLKRLVRIFRYSGTSTGRILGIHGGTGDLGQFIRLYDREFKKFKAPGADKPLILLVDNDSGAKDPGKIFAAIRDVLGARPSGHEPFIHVSGNLYVVPTPLSKGATHSSMEDFFDDKTKAKPVGGKTFDPANDFETATHYGKHVFAQRVVSADADSIDFSGFKPILSNLVAVIDAHSKRYPAGAPAVPTPASV